MNLSIEQFFGYAKALMDQLGLTPFVYVILIIGVATYVYNKFFNKD